MDSVMSHWLEKFGPEEEVVGFLGGRRFNDGFSAWGREHGTLAPDLTAEEFDKVRLPHEPLEVDYLWSPTNEKQDEGVFVARVFNVEKNKEVKGSRFHSKNLDFAVAAAANFIKHKHYK